MNLKLIYSKKTNYIEVQRYSCDLGYEIKIVTIGIDTHIMAEPPMEVQHIAPSISFISKESGSIDIKNISVSTHNASIFTEWVVKANELVRYIYEHYDELKVFGS